MRVGERKLIDSDDDIVLVAPPADLTLRRVKHQRFGKYAWYINCQHATLQLDGTATIGRFEAARQRTHTGDALLRCDAKVDKARAGRERSGRAHLTFPAHGSLLESAPWREACHIVAPLLGQR